MIEQGHEELRKNRQLTEQVPGVIRMSLLLHLTEQVPGVIRKNHRRQMRQQGLWEIRKTRLHLLQVH
jgi:hypothetical protein